MQGKISQAASRITSSDLGLLESQLLQVPSFSDTVTVSNIFSDEQLRYVAIMFNHVSFIGQGYELKSYHSADVTLLGMEAVQLESVEKAIEFLSTKYSFITFCGHK